jgi:type IV pilus assembly protein PilC
MTAFSVTYTTRTGRKKVLTLEAESPADAKRALRRRGITYNNLTRKEGSRAAESSTAPKSTSQNVFSRLLESPPTIKDKAVFASKLSTLVNAGVPILRSIDLIYRQQKSALFRRALAAMIEEVNQGENLASSMRRWP